MQVNNLNDPVSMRKRGPLSMPAPQVSHRTRLLAASPPFLNPLSRSYNIPI